MARRIVRKVKRTDAEEMKRDKDTAADPEVQFEAIVDAVKEFSQSLKNAGYSFVCILHNNDPISDTERMAWFKTCDTPTAIGLTSMLSDNVCGFGYDED